MGKHTSRKKLYFTRLAGQVFLSIKNKEKLFGLNIGNGNCQNKLLQLKARINQILNRRLQFVQPEIKNLPSNPQINRQIKADETISSTESHDYINKYIYRTLNERDNCAIEMQLIKCNHAFATKSYGIHDEAGFPFWGTILTRGQTKINYPRGYPTKIKPPSNIDIQLDRAFYINFLQLRNFGHFLTDGASAIYPLIEWTIQNSDLKSIPIIINEQDSSQDCQIDLLTDLLKISKSQIYIPGKTCGNLAIKTLYQSKPSFILGVNPSEQHQQIVRSLLHQKFNISTYNPPIEDQKRKNTSKLYISRSKLNASERHLKEEHEIEKYLTRLGWLTIHPQTLKIEEQLELYENCSIICAEEGSAIHLFFGLRKHQLKRIILLAQSYKSNFTMQLDSQSIPKTIIKCLAHDPSCIKKGTRQNVKLKNYDNSLILAKEIDNYALEYLQQ